MSVRGEYNDFCSVFISVFMLLLQAAYLGLKYILCFFIFHCFDIDTVLVGSRSIGTIPSSMFLHVGG